MSKKDFGRFVKRNTHKRKGKEAQRAALLKAINDLGVCADGVKLSGSVDLGRRGRTSFKKRSDEVIAEGIFSSSRSGFGFVKTEESERDIFIPEDKTLFALDGDRVEIIYHTFRDRFGEERTEGRVKKIIEYGRKTVIGTVEENRVRHGRRVYVYRYILPDDPRVNMRPVVDEDGGARLGEKVLAEIKRSDTGEPCCDIVRVFGDAESREANYEAILADEGIPVDFTPEELDEARRVAEVPITSDGRSDLREEIVFTIDSESSKDLDDAVSVERLPDGGYRLGVHIADVAHYVKEKTPLDRAVMARGTSVYFTDKVVPMLPVALSNGACSLNPNEDRYALSALIRLDAEGEIISSELRETVIRSRIKGIYSEINSIFEGTAREQIIEKYSPVMSRLNDMREVYFVLKAKSDARGYLDFDAPEAEIVLDERGIPVEIIKKERGLSERMIEQLMLTANEAVATLLYEKGIPCVYRIHEPPPPDKLSDLLDYLHNLGFDTRVVSRDNLNSRSIGAVLDMAKEKGVFDPVSYATLRAMSKAHYSEVKKPHFGLGIETYCHFTSPIRRLSDLATHRIIKKVLLGDKKPAYYSSYARRAAAAASDTELRAVSAERRIENLYKALYMQERVGECFDGVISSVTGFGIFVLLDNTCEGLLPMSELPFGSVYDEKNLTVRSREGVWRVGDAVRVTLEEADIVRGKLRFSFAEDEP